MPNPDPSIIPASLAVTNNLDDLLVCGALRIPPGAGTVVFTGMPIPLKIQSWNAVVRATTDLHLTSLATELVTEQSCTQALTGCQISGSGQTDGRGGQADLKQAATGPAEATPPV